MHAASSVLWKPQRCACMLHWRWLSSSARARHTGGRGEGSGGPKPVSEDAQQVGSRRGRPRPSSRSSPTPSSTTSPSRAPAAHVSGESRRKQALKKKPKIPATLVPTPSEYVWGVGEMDPNFILPPAQVKSHTKAIFSSKPLYLDPSSLGYKMPDVQADKHTEVAFLGRSNVGKSSLVGSLLGHKQLVRVSKTPGCTRSLNLFAFKGHPLYFVDLPGYGFASAPAKARETWLDVTDEYLQTRGIDVLRRVLLLIDARHGVMAVDEEAMSLFDHHTVPYQLVLTKADALRGGVEARRDVVQAAAEVAMKREHACCWPVIAVTSAKEGYGLQEVRESIVALMHGF